MASKLSSEQGSAVAALLRAGNNVKEIGRLLDVERDLVTSVARSLDLTPSDKTQKRAKDLFTSDAAMSYADVANVLADEGLRNDGEPVHYLTVATWVANQGWAWGGSDDGDYAPNRAATSPSRSRFTLRMSRATIEEINSDENLAAAADAAWAALDGDETTLVAVAVVKGAAAAGATDIAGVKAALMERHGDAIRMAKAS